jgi:hypothetical protein
LVTLFVSDMETVAPALSTRQPALERLLARAAVRRLEQPAWAWLAALAGGAAGVLPVAPVSALGDGRNDPGSWLRVEPLGADAEGQGGFRLRAAGLGIAAGEALALAEAFNETFEGDGLRLEVAAPERWYLVVDAAAPGRRDWRGFDRPAGHLRPGERPAPPEPGLRRLLSEVELLFHPHPVNEARRARGRAVIAGLHPWGGGEMPSFDSLPKAAGGGVSRAMVLATPATEEPYLAGLRHLGALPACPAPASRATWPASAAADNIAWPVSIESMDAGALDRIEADWAVPLLAQLRRGRLKALRIITSRRVFTLRPVDAWRTWRRPRPLAELA